MPELIEHLQHGEHYGAHALWRVGFRMLSFMLSFTSGIRIRFILCRVVLKSVLCDFFGLCCVVFQLATRPVCVMLLFIRCYVLCCVCAMICFTVCIMAFPSLLRFFCLSVSFLFLPCVIRSSFRVCHVVLSVSVEFVRLLKVLPFAFSPLRKGIIHALQSHPLFYR